MASSTTTTISTVIACSRSRWRRFSPAPDIDMPFALMWANENWTRRWDGMESEILITQDYRAEDDRALCADFLRHFRDPRYIRASGRPLLMIYRPALIPKARERLAAWRRIFRRKRRRSDPDHEPGLR